LLEAPINAEDLVRIVEGSMSSPVYELLKRPDELFVVEHAHLQPRFVEDSVRIALRDTLETYPELGADDFLRKPFSTVVLRARVRALRRRPRGSGECGFAWCGLCERSFGLGGRGVRPSRPR